MSLVREAIAVAHFNLIRQAMGIGGPAPLAKKVTRILRHYVDVPAEECPFVAPTQPSENHQWPNPALEDVIRMTCKVWVYVKTNTGSDIAPGTVMNPILDALQSAYNPEAPVTNKQTLGGLVKHARINGEIITSEGWLGNTEIAVIPVELLVSSLM